MLEGTRIRTYDSSVLLHEEDEETQHNIANMMTSDWGRFKGPPSASEWTFGSAGRSNAVQNRSRGREVGVRAQHENEAQPRSNTAYRVKSVRL